MKSIMGWRNRLGPALAAAWMAIGIASVHSGEAGAAGKRIEASAGLAAFYDDNLLEYSDNQRADFDSGLHPERFSIQSLDDVVWRPSLSVSFANRLARGRSWRFSLTGRGELHSQDKTADFRSLNAEWRQSLSRRNGFFLRGYYLPHFYLRQLFDEDAVPLPTRYRRAEFALGIGSVGWRQRISRGTSARFGYQFERRTYNPEFRERDTSTHQGQLGIAWSRRGVGLGVHGGYRWSGAKGTDGDELPGTPPDDPDISYHGLISGVDGRMNLIRRSGWKVTGSLGYELETRDYTSKVPTDDYHFGRNDLLQSVEAGLRWSAGPHWAVRAFYDYDHNRADLSVPAPATSDVGSYTSNRVGIAFDWTGVLWREAAQRETGQEPDEGD